MLNVATNHPDHVLLSGGKALHAQHLNKFRKLNQNSKIEHYREAFIVLEEKGFGDRVSKNHFQLHDNIMERVNQGTMKSDLVSMCVSTAMLNVATNHPDHVPLPTASKKRKITYVETTFSLPINTNLNREELNEEDLTQIITSELFLNK